MSIFKKSLTVIFAALVLVFLIQNVEGLATTISLGFLNMGPIDFKAGIWFFILYLLGIITWMVADAWRSLGRERKIRLLKKEVQAKDKELAKLQQQLSKSTEPNSALQSPDKGNALHSDSKNSSAS